jgi:hypothetical protein
MERGLARTDGREPKRRPTGPVNGYRIEDKFGPQPQTLGNRGTRKSQLLHNKQEKHEESEGMIVSYYLLQQAKKSRVDPTGVSKYCRIRPKCPSNTSNPKRFIM